MTDAAPTTVYPARQIRTMNPMAPVAQAISVRGDRILGVGSREAVLAHARSDGSPVDVDDRFADAVLLPGLIEAHSHITTTGMVYQMPAYAGAYDRPAPHGTFTACRSVADVVARLKAVAAQAPDQPVLAWGYDPALLDGFPNLTTTELDQVSQTQLVAVLNLSGHILYVNSVGLKAVGYDSSTTVPGVKKGPDGNPNGVLEELAAFAPFMSLVAAPDPAVALRGVSIVAEMAQRKGLTTISDLLTTSEGEVALQSSYTHSADVRSRIACYYAAPSLAAMSPPDALALLARLTAANDDWFRVAGVKVVADGSIQGYTAFLAQPPYYDGHPQGLRNIDPASIAGEMQRYHDAGYQLAIHTNGDGATQEILDALTTVLAHNPRPDHRHRLEHAQMINAGQIRRMADLGVGANVFTKHLWYWGDFHRQHSLGPDRAQWMDPVRTPTEAGVHVSYHSDCFVSPIDQLEAAWCAVTRATQSGVVLGEDERVDIDTALRAVTLEAAWLLHEDDRKGSLQAGKLADITVLDRPLERPEDLRAAVPLATVLGGTVLPIDPAAG